MLERYRDKLRRSRETYCSRWEEHREDRRREMWDELREWASLWPPHRWGFRGAMLLAIYAILLFADAAKEIDPGYFNGAMVVGLLWGRSLLFELCYFASHEAMPDRCPLCAEDDAAVIEHFTRED